MVPVEPIDFIVVTVSVIITSLASHEFIACNHHRNTHRQHMDGCEVLYLTFTEVANPLILCLSLGTTVPAAVIINSIIISLTIGPVVLFVISS